MTPTLSIIVPTIGRPSLARALASLAPAGMAPVDEVVVVSDGHDAHVRACAQGASAAPGSTTFIEGAPTGDWGATQRNVGMAKASGTHLVFLDDDDVLTPGALDAIRGAIMREPCAPLIFRMRKADGTVLPGPDNRIDPDLADDGHVHRGRIGTPCIVVPNDQVRNAKWPPCYECDWGFISMTLEEWDPVEPVFCDTVVCEVAENEHAWGSVAIATCLYGTVRPEFVQSWSDLIAAGSRPGDVLMRGPVDMAVHEARNTVVQSFLGEPTYAHCGSLLFVDHDHQFTPDALAALRADPRGWGYDLMGAVYRARHTGAPLVYRRDPDGDGLTFEMVPGWSWGDVVDVDVMGMGFTLVRRRVLETLHDPWFYYAGPGSSEDIAFCRDAQLRGFHLGINTAVGVDHVVTRVLPGRSLDTDKRLYAHIEGG